MDTFNEYRFLLRMAKVSLTKSYGMHTIGYYFWLRQELILYVLSIR